MSHKDSRLESLLEKSIFASRWLQAPLYVGLIVAQGIYVYQFFIELWHLLHSAFSGQVPAGSTVPDLSTFIMLNVLGLIDVVRTHWPFLRDRRIDSYGEIVKRFID